MVSVFLRGVIIVFLLLPTINSYSQTEEELDQTALYIFWCQKVFGEIDKSTWDAVRQNVVAEDYVAANQIVANKQMKIRAYLEELEAFKPIKELNSHTAVLADSFRYEDESLSHLREVIKILSIGEETPKAMQDAAYHMDQANHYMNLAILKTDVAIYELRKLSDSELVKQAIEEYWEKQKKEKGKGGK